MSKAAKSHFLKMTLHVTIISRLLYYMSLGLSIVWIGISTPSVNAQSTSVVEPPLPTRVESGYFPTLGESALLKGGFNSRSLGQGLNMQDGPDLGQQISQGIFPYVDSEPDFYQRNQGFFKPINQTLGVFTPHDAWTKQFNELDNTSLTLDGNLGVLTRQFSPDLAQFKAGPLYLDVLWLGGGILWSDYNGDRTFTSPSGSRNRGDGTLAYVNVGIRGLLRLSDSLYLTAVTNLMYFPFDNRIALRFGNGGAGLLSRLNYSKTIGDWDILAYDQFQGRPGLNFFGDGNINGSDRAGRYFYGYQTNGPSNEFYNQNYVLLNNKLALNASRLVFDNQWRLWLAADHNDFWRSISFDNHSQREHIGAALGYEGSSIPFAPLFTYDVFSYNKFETLYHRTYLNLKGRLTENLSWQGRFGYLYTTGSGIQYDRFLWQMGLTHALTQNTSHTLTFGQNVFDSPVTNESFVGRFVNYSIDQRLTSRLSLRAFAQYTESETVLPSLQTRNRIGTGISIRYQPLDFTQLMASVVYTQIDHSTSGALADSNRWRYRVDASQQLGLRLTGHLFYQYEDYSTVSTMSFSEHVIGLSLRRYF